MWAVHAWCSSISQPGGQVIQNIIWIKLGISCNILTFYSFARLLSFFVWLFSSRKWWNGLRKNHEENGNYNWVNLLHWFLIDDPTNRWFNFFFYFYTECRFISDCTALALSVLVFLFAIWSALRWVEEQLFFNVLTNDWVIDDMQMISFRLTPT